MRLSLDGAVLSQLVLLQVPQHFFYTLQVSSSRASRRRGRAIAGRLNAHCDTYV